ncbi:receptor-like protein kinase [Populus alba x Populus x berolinensis]|uniref:Receptor-like protein kinase n=1 Tax=Populus alba x Populus x berolinensis TaxID=444605 RepID=A0AAD6QCZ4_9ROSI|nr:receptor-like protein kinase [Populus alba x Populus x berolinensis]
MKLTNPITGGLKTFLFDIFLSHQKIIFFYLPYCRHPMAILLVLLLPLLSWPSIVSAGGNTFKPADEFLISCGARSLASVPDGRLFKTDHEAQGYLQTKQDILVSVPSADVPSPIYLSARIFKEDATYAFTLKSAGWHWVRLHFFPINNTEFDLRTATFSVNTDKYALLHNFNINNNTEAVLKEYLINMTDPNFSIQFKPLKNSAAFINAIEVVSAPDILISDQATNLFPVNDFAENDTLSRRWVPDKPYLKHEALAKSASVPTSSIKYGPGTSPLIAPATVYASAKQMADSETRIQNFNITWNFVADATFSYVVRLHFCDIVSKTLNDLYFNVYLNGKKAISGLDLSSIEDELAVPYFKDIVVDASLMSNGLAVEVGPMGDETGTRNAILNGLEVFKMSSKVNSLDGVFGVDGEVLEKHRVVTYVGFGLMFGAFIGLGAMVLKWHKRPQDWQKRNSFSSWLLPVHAATPGAISTSVAEDNKSPAEAQVIDEHSGTAMFAQFSGLNGRKQRISRCQSSLSLSLKMKKPDRTRRGGLSRYYSGKQGHLTCIADARCLEDLKEPERPDLPRKGRNIQIGMACTFLPYPCRRVI